MKKIYIAIAATIIAATCIFFACSKEEENTHCSKTIFNKNNASLSQFIKSVDTPEEIDFFKQHKITDNSDFCKKIMTDSKIQKENTNRPFIKFKWSGSGYTKSIGICLVVPFEVESNAEAIVSGDKCVIIPSTSDNGLTSDGYLPIFEDVALDEERMISKGIYKATYDKTTKEIAVAVDLK